MKQCWLCGNFEREYGVVGGHDGTGFVECCERCIGVVVDRTKNLPDGPALVRAENETRDQRDQRERRQAAMKKGTPW